MKRISPTTVEIDLEAIRWNYQQARKRLPSGVKTLCVIKSNAYGHGAARIGRILQEEGADFFGAGTIDEGIDLREAGIKKPILILLGLIDGYFEALLRYQLTPVLYDLETARQLDQYLAGRGKKLPIHVKTDTGMSRLGVLPAAMDEFCAQLKKCNWLEPVGLLTHLADAGGEAFTKGQIKKFEKARQTFVEFFPNTNSFHLANSQASIDGLVIATEGRSPSAGSGASKAKQMGGAGGNLPACRGGCPKGTGGAEERLSPPDQWMARLGIILYGAYPLPRDKKLVSLKPVLRWKSRVTALKKLPAKTPVSYGRTFATKRDSVIGVVPVGYADGYPRNLSNQADVLVRGKRAPIIGTICMDMMMVDLTGVSGVKRGDEVVLIGRQGTEEIRAEELADEAGTISYEIFCRISDRIPRVFIES